MKEVWKYPIDTTAIADNQEIKIPIGSKLVHTGLQEKTICLWFEVNPKEKLYDARSFRVYGTGHPIENGSYIGTVIWPSITGTQFVWHIYETT